MSGLVYGSVCSGIESATVAWAPLGWRPAWFAEIDDFCSRLLGWHYPEVANLGDVCNVTEAADPIDVLVGGTPCQSFSVNGHRSGVADPRGQVMFEYCRVARLLHPRWLVWENVPGVLTSSDGEDFRCLLRSLDELGYCLAWRVLDLSGFGIPQRRRRVFLVGHLGGLAPLALFEPGAGRGDAAPSGGIHGETPTAGGDSCVPWGWTGDPTPKFCRGLSLTIRSGQGGEGVGFARGGLVAPFTVAQMEALTGLPDGYTEIIGATKKERTKAIGNTFPPPVLAWIGHRISVIDGRT